MNKKPVIISLFLMLIFVGGTWYFFQHKKKIASVDAAYAIPLDAGLVVKSENFPKLLMDISSKSMLWKELVKLDFFSGIDEQILILDSLNRENSFIQKMLNNNTVHISAHLVGKNSVGFIFYVPVKTAFGTKQITDNLVDILAENTIISNRKYDNYEIIDVKLKNRKNGELSYAVTNNLLILSFSSILLENALRQTQQPTTIENLHGFKQVAITEGKNAHSNVYVNFNTMSKMLACGMHDKLQQKIKSLDNIALWAELDMDIKKEALLLNGFSYTSDSANNIMNILLGQQPVKITTENIFPASTSSFFVLGLSNTEKFATENTTYLNKKGELNSHKFTIESLNKNYNIDLEKTFYSILESEIGTVRLNTGKPADEENTFFIVKTKGANAAREEMNEMLKSIAKAENTSFNSYVSTYKVDNQVDYSIYQFPIHNVFKILWGTFFSFENANYYTFINNYAVFGNSKKSLSEFIQNNVLHKTLNSNIEYHDFSEYINSRSNLYFYSKLAKSGDIAREYLSTSIYKSYFNNIDIFKKVNALALQCGVSNNMIYNNVLLKYVSEVYEEPVTDWQTLLDTLINMKPKFVTNHYTNENEIVVQDLKQNIYLINNNGRILWKVPLEQEIISDIYQVDYFKNNKLQILFNTKNKLYLLDRNGNNVEKYPITLREEASTGLSLFDYENNRNYRIFIPAKDRKIYLYNIEGKIIPGWDFDKTDQPLLTPLQHFRAGTKDYIVFADDNKVYITDRRGNTRVTPQEQVSKSPKNIFYLNTTTSGKECLVTTDTKGNICYLFFDGKTEKFNLKEYSAQHFFECNDMTGNGLNDYIFVDEDKIDVYNHEMKKSFTFKFSQIITQPPVYFHFGQYDRKIGIVSFNKKEIYLINNDGTIYEGFPLTGRTLFSIGYLKNRYGKFNLLVGGENNFLYNYSVN